MNEYSLNTNFFYLNNFITVALIHLLAVVSPGPDFIVVIRQCNKYGRKSAVLTSFGIAIGILFHVSYCIIGVGFINENTSYMYAVRIFGSLYLFYIGFKSLFLKNKISLDDNVSISHNSLNNSFILGFITNIFNPKATLFFLSVFSLVIHDSTPVIIKSLYGIWMCLVTGIWFCLVSFFFTTKIFEIFISKYSLIIDKIMGVLLMYISTKLFLF